MIREISINKIAIKNIFILKYSRAALSPCGVTCARAHITTPVTTGYSTESAPFEYDQSPLDKPLSPYKAEISE